MRLFSLAACLLLGSPGVLAQTCPPVPTSPVRIGNIVFINAGLLPAETQEEISTKLREEAASIIDGPMEFATQADPDQGATNLVDEAAERVRAAYQNAGYFKVQVSGERRRISADLSPRYDIVVQVVDAGPQYRLGDLNIVGAPHFPAQQLRDLFPIQRGDIFSREKIAKGLEDLRALYDSDGYINTTPVPETDLDDTGIANLTIDVDEGRQFRLRSVEIVGVDLETKSRLLEGFRVKPGDLYTGEIRELSVAGSRSVAHVEQKLDEREGWVDIVVDFSQSKPCRTARPDLPQN